MKRLSTEFITEVVAMPIKSGTLEFLQDAYKEIANAIAVAVIGNMVADIGYILYGCKNTGTGSNYIISAGAIYLNGEIFLVPAATFTVSGNAAIGTITVTQFTTNADPVEFTDAVTHNVHNIRQLVFAAGTSHSSDVDFLDLINNQLVLVNDQQATLPSSYTVKFDQDKSIFFAAASSNTSISFDFTNAIPGCVVRMKWTYGSGKTLTINTASGQNIIRDSGDLGAVASANNLIYFLYVGVNENGDDEVSYTLKQV